MSNSFFGNVSIGNTNKLMGKAFKSFDLLLLESN